MDVFRQYGIDAQYEEATPDNVIREKIRAWDQLRPRKRSALAKALATANSTEITDFLSTLAKTAHCGFQQDWCTRRNCRQAIR
jgi:hypothetical protein